MKRTLIPALFVATACATFGSGPDVDDRYERGLQALLASDYTAAVREFDWVGRLRPGTSIGQQALLLGTTAAIDPRNPGRDYAAAGLFAMRLRDAGATWTAPIGESLRLIATELASSATRIADAESARDQAFAIATGQRAHLEAQLEAIAAERDTLVRKTATLEQTLAERDKQVKDKEQELERIRKIVRG